MNFENVPELCFRRCLDLLDPRARDVQLPRGGGVGAVGERQRELAKRARVGRARLVRWDEAAPYSRRVSRDILDGVLEDQRAPNRGGRCRVHRRWYGQGAIADP
jgi:hypothetical protein